MIISIIKTYLPLLLGIAGISLFIFTIGLYLIFKNPAAKKPHADNKPLDTDFSAIAGDDEIATQLDLARAYIETDKKSLAKSILHYVLRQGNAEQQQEAQQLMKHI